MKGKKIKNNDKSDVGCRIADDQINFIWDECAYKVLTTITQHSS